MKAKHDGLFKGTANGLYGTLTSKILIKDGNITHVNVEGIKPYTVGAYAAPTIIHQIKKTGGTDVDIVTGASITTSAIVNGVNKALEVANGRMTVQEAADPQIKPMKMINKPVYPVVNGEYLLSKQVDFADTYDVIIAGGGIAGLTAAIEAKKHGNKVVIFEKTGMLGGSGNLSMGVIQAAGDTYQKKFTKFQHDTSQKYAKELIQAGGNQVNPKIIRELTTFSAKNINWLACLGLKWEKVYGHSLIPYEKKDYFAQRIHVYKHGGGIGQGGVLTHVLKEEADRLGVKVMYNQPVTNLVVKSAKNKTVIGVVSNYKGKRIAHRAVKGVVLATAGIDHNERLAREFAPQQYRDLKHNAVITSKYDTGDGMLMGLNLGAATEGLGGSIDADFFCLSGFADSIPALPLIYVNGNGLRYVNEETTFGYLTRASYQQEKIWQKPTWQIFDNHLFEQKNSPWKKEEDLAPAKKKGRFFKAATILDLARKIKVPTTNLQKQIRQWNQDAQKNKDSEFGRKNGISTFSAPFYAYQLQNSNIGSIGGLRVNSNYEVLNRSGDKICHLYAIGCNSGGWNAGYYPGSGLSLAEAIHSGRKVGRVLSGLVKPVNSQEN